MPIHVVVEGFPWSAVSAIVSAFAALGTFGAVVVALRGQSQEGRARREDAAIAESKRAAYLTAQAKCVYLEAKPYSPGGYSSSLVRVVNYSDRPILDVEVTPFGYSDGAPHAATLEDTKRVLPAGSENSWDLHTSDSRFVQVVWRDPDGGTWEASIDGGRFGQITPGPDSALSR